MSDRLPERRAYDPLKRALDATLALVLLVVLSPLMAAIALAVAIGMGRPVIFRQTRAGFLGEPFDLLKFRTMRPAPDGMGHLEAVGSDAERLTRLGRFLRATSLDELPQLLNVLRGQMSFVGPRPLLLDYLERYTPEQARRHDVRPGITGLAQVSGRNALSWEERLALDVRYIDERSLALDSRILVKTLAVALSREGVAEPGGATATPFSGTAEKNGSEEKDAT